MTTEQTFTTIVQRPEVEGNWLYKDFTNRYTGEVTRQFRLEVGYDSSAQAWGECTDAEKTAYETAHSTETLEQRTVRYIRERYSTNQEYEALRKMTTDPEGFATYNAYVEECIERAKKELEPDATE